MADHDTAEEADSRLVSIAVRLGINAAALWLAAAWVRGFEIEGWPSLVAAAVIFAVVNAVIKPVAKLMGLPISCLTMGLFALLINAAMLALTAWIAGQFDFNVEIDGFLAALFAALLISVVSTLLSVFVGRPLRWALR
ncbi:MAG: phage holin family protein [Chloroflexi bacterium]|nr:phage holin family protein [Chloroflexota bacterium]